MLNGSDPILIFLFYKANSAVTVSKIPLANELGLNRLSLPPVPIYLSERATGIYIDEEDKNLDIQTNTETLRNGASPIVTQKGIGSTITINMIANKNSLGLQLLSAMSDLIFGKLTSKEYGVTYLHGPITIFNGLIHGFQVKQVADTDKLTVTLELARSGGSALGSIEVPGISGTASLNDANVLTSVTSPGAAGGASALPVQTSVPMGGPS